MRIVKDLDLDLAGRHVLIVEDIVDCGPHAALPAPQPRRAQPGQPRGVRPAACKEGLQRDDPDLRYVGFRIPPDFVVGYGLDVAERYRNLPDVCVYQPDGRGRCARSVASPGRVASPPTTHRCRRARPQRRRAGSSLALVGRRSSSPRAAPAAATSAEKLTLDEFEADGRRRRGRHRHDQGPRPRGHRRARPTAPSTRSRFPAEYGDELTASLRDARRRSSSTPTSRASRSGSACCSACCRSSCSSACSSSS